MGFVYLLLSVNDYGDEVYKIGITRRNVQKRVLELQTGNSNKISLLKSYESKNYLKIEQWLHKQYHLITESDNEWRKLSSEEVLSFELNCKKADEIINFMLANNHFYK